MRGQRRAEENARLARVEQARRTRGRGRSVAASIVAVVALACLGYGLHSWQASSASPGERSAWSDAPAAVEATSGSAGTREDPDVAPAVQGIEDLSELPWGRVDRIEVAYFHRTVRCAGCIKAEELTRKTLDTYFQDRLASGQVVLRVEDVQKPADPALVQRYGAYGKSLYLGVLKGGVIYVYPVAHVWLVLNDDARFQSVLRGAIQTALAGQ